MYALTRIFRVRTQGSDIFLLPRQFQGPCCNATVYNARPLKLASVNEIAKHKLLFTLVYLTFA